MTQFETRLERALERVKVVLDNTRTPCWAGDVHHTYQDKYALAESMTNAAAASQLNSLALLGATPGQLAKFCLWAQTKTVSLRFSTEEF
jgi:hypothetical protein